MSASRPTIFKHASQLLPNLDVTCLIHEAGCFKTIRVNHLDLSRLVALVSLLAFGAWEEPGPDPSLSSSNFSLSLRSYGPDHHTACALCGRGWSWSGQRHITSNHGIAVRLSEEQAHGSQHTTDLCQCYFLIVITGCACFFCFALFFKVLKVHAIWVPSVMFLPSVRLHFTSPFICKKPFLTTAGQESVFPFQLQPTGIFMITFCFRAVYSVEKCDSTAALPELCP